MSVWGVGMSLERGIEIGREIVGGWSRLSHNFTRGDSNKIDIQMLASSTSGQLRRRGTEAGFERVVMSVARVKFVVCRTV